MQTSSLEKLTHKELKTQSSRLVDIRLHHPYSKYFCCKAEHLGMTDSRLEQAIKWPCEELQFVVHVSAWEVAAWLTQPGLTYVHNFFFFYKRNVLCFSSR